MRKMGATQIVTDLVTLSRCRTYQLSSSKTFAGKLEPPRVSSFLECPLSTGLLEGCASLSHPFLCKTHQNSKAVDLAVASSALPRLRAKDMCQLGSSQ